MSEPSDNLRFAWSQQCLWSETANRLKHGIGKARTTALGLGIGAGLLAVLAVEAAGLRSWLGRVLGFAAAAAAGLAPLVGRRAGTDQVRTWTRARSASEGLKTEVYSYLAGGSAYLAQDADHELGVRSRRIVDAVGDLLRTTIGVQLVPKPIPEVHDVDSYVAHRVTDQIERYYRPKALHYERVASRLRRSGEVLGGCAVLLGAGAASFGIGGLAAWVPAVTTVSASLTAYIAASRYDHQIVEFLRTAEQLERLRDARAAEAMADAAFVDACEEVISVENQGWMTQWSKSPTT